MGGWADARRVVSNHNHSSSQSRTVRSGREREIERERVKQTDSAEADTIVSMY